MQLNLEVGTGKPSRGECKRELQGLSCSAESEKSRVQRIKQDATVVQLNLFSYLDLSHDLPYVLKCDIACRQSSYLSIQVSCDVDRIHQGDHTIQAHTIRKLLI